MDKHSTATKRITQNTKRKKTHNTTNTPTALRKIKRRIFQKPPSPQSLHQRKKPHNKIKWQQTENTLYKKEENEKEKQTTHTDSHSYKARKQDSQYAKHKNTQYSNSYNTHQKATRLQPAQTHKNS